MSTFLFLVSIFFTCILSLVSPFFAFSVNLSKQCLDDQRSSLLQLQQDLYNAPNFTFSSKLELWGVNSTDCCRWKGVSCDVFGHVIKLDLSYQNISGNFHSVFNLHHLQHLNLAGNNFNTTLLLYEFDKLSNLTHLNLSKSCFHGQIPMGVSFLTRLVSLDLSNQKHCYWRNDVDFYDSPALKLEKPNFKTLIKRLRFLSKLYLDGVDISFQSIEWCETTSLLLPHLQVLSLSNCGLKGPLCPSLSKLTFFSKLFLDHNPISSLPSNFMEIFSRLISLSLVDCNLSGYFPTQILLLPKIQNIDISYNEQLLGHLPEFSSNSSLRSLNLFDTNFSGKVPDSIGNLKSLTDLTLSMCDFFGSIPSSIANLPHLVNLDLSNNNFNGLIPPFHGLGVPNLSSLYLGGNKLFGSINSSLFTLPSLRVLSLGENQLVGKINEFSNVSSSLIEGVKLGNNYFTGPIPKSILQLPRLQWLEIAGNSFSSMKLDMFVQIKNLKNLYLSNITLIESDNKSLTFPQLEELRLSSCNLTEFPEFIKTQDKLTYLDLSGNHIHGVVPNWLWKTNLSSLGLSFNPIEFPKQLLMSDANLSFPKLRALGLGSCNISAFPDFLRSQDQLLFLDLSNNGISGAIPNWVWKKSLIYLNLAYNRLSFSTFNSSQVSSPSPICNLRQLQRFNASHNNLSGTIPNCLGNMSSLYFLDLQGNNFTGILPEFSNANELWILKVSDNRLEGKLPRSLAECTQLQVLDVGNNTLRDIFPFWLEKLPALDVLDISSNQFYGELSIDFLQDTQLRSLKIGGNKLQGKLPRSLANCSKLEVLDLGNNMVHDTFPFWLAKLPSLKVLILRGNRFYGTIQKNDCECGHGFPELRILDIASNNFSGALSVDFLQSFKAMMQISNEEKANRKYIGEFYYQDSVTIVNRGILLFYEKVLTTLTCLDLSNNSFHGRIPEEIQILKSLMVLNLSNNEFSSQIPFTFENLKYLESLGLSENKLSGKIPPQLASLTFLAVLNLSYNQLEGSIPQGYQFNTFSNDSYLWNPKLCGLPLSRKCSEVDLPKPPPAGGDEGESWLDAMSIWQIALIGYASGLVVGICFGFTVLNELGNKWVFKFKMYGKRNRRRSTRLRISVSK